MSSELISRYAPVLNEAQDLVNTEIKLKYEFGEITSIYGENGSYLDVIQIFDYTKDFWKDHLILSEINELLLKIKIYNISPPVAKSALRLICSFIIATNTLHYWSGERKLHLYNRLLKYFPANKPLNYDYLRFVINQDITITNEEGVIVS